MEMTPTEWHQQLNELANSLLKIQEPESALVLFKRTLPDLFEQIEESGDSKTFLDLWGKSLNVDENTATLIVEPGILEILSRLTGVSLSSTIVHAGIEHTYGYLFSLIETPYGMKRDRWVEPYLERALGLAQPTFSPIVSQGTLLNNLTYFLGRISFRGRSSEIQKLRRGKSRIDPELVQMNYRRLKTIRMVEELSSQRQRFRIITDLIELPAVPEYHQFKGILIYSVENLVSQKPKLITTFPVSASTFSEICTLPTGMKVEVQTKYNAFLEGVPREPLFGSRRLID